MLAEVLIGAERALTLASPVALPLVGAVDPTATAVTNVNVVDVGVPVTITALLKSPPPPGAAMPEIVTVSPARRRAEVVSVWVAVATLPSETMPVITRLTAVIRGSSRT